MAAKRGWREMRGRSGFLRHIQSLEVLEVSYKLTGRDRSRNRTRIAQRVVGDLWSNSCGTWGKEQRSVVAGGERKQRGKRVRKRERNKKEPN